MQSEHSEQVLTHLLNGVKLSYFRVEHEGALIVKLVK